jgi:hypothetical protein
VTDAGESGFAGNAEPNCRTEAAALMDFHGSSRARVEGGDRVLRHAQSYQDGAAANTHGAYLG